MKNKSQNKSSITTMKDFSLFGQFVKAKRQTILPTTLNCVIYTRVSTKEQADNNMSLETQRKACEKFSNKSGYTIMGSFGGTYESAKTDERKEFNRMLLFVKKSKQKICYIIVYSVDRFSRSGANAIYLKEQLKQQGVLIMAVSQPTDTSTPSGSLQQNIQFIFSEYDNQLRKEKCMAGVKEAISRGEWCHRAPSGYDVVRRDGKRILIVNAIGKKLRKAFLWKADEGLSIEEIILRLKTIGLNIYHQKLCWILRNPFYCGIISHASLDGALIEGTQEKLISKEVFLKVNDILNQHNHGYSVNHENDNVPLKGFLKCDRCNSNLPGYIVKKKKLWYYKCRTTGCCNNKSAKQIHSKFQEMISSFVFADKYKNMLIEQMTRTYIIKNKDNFEIYNQLNNQLSVVQKKLERLEERHILEEISKDMYEKYRLKFKDEMDGIHKRLHGIPAQVSNLNDCIERVVNYSQNLHIAWGKGEYKEKQQLQFLVFPEGIHYNKQKDKCRTPKIQTPFLWTTVKSQEISKNKIGIPSLNLKYANLVELWGKVSNRFPEDLQDTYLHIIHKK